MFTPSTIKALLSLKEHNADAPFYASDFGFSGGVMSVLASNEVICETGNAKVYTIPPPLLRQTAHQMPVQRVDY